MRRSTVAKRFTSIQFVCSGLLFASLVLAGACVSARAPRAPRIAVAFIDGSESAQRALSKAVDRRYHLVSTRSYAKTARKLDAESDRSKDVKKVARKLKIDAVVMGEFVKKSKKKYELRLVLREGHSGKKIDSLTIKFKSKRLRKKDLRKITKNIYEVLRYVKSRDYADEEDASPKRVAKKRKSKHHKKDRRSSYKRVVTVRDEAGQAVDSENPF